MAKVILDGIEYKPFGDQVCVRTAGSTDEAEIRNASAVPAKVREHFARSKYSHNFDTPAVLGVPGAVITRAGSNAPDK